MICAYTSKLRFGETPNQHARRVRYQERSQAAALRRCSYEAWWRQNRNQGCL